MKKVFMLILFLAVFKLYAVAHSADTLVTKSAGNGADSAKKTTENRVADSAKKAGNIRSADSIKTIKTNQTPDSTKNIVVKNSADSLKIIPISQIADSAKAIAALRVDDNAKAIPESHTSDSVKSTEATSAYIDPKIIVLGEINNATKAAAVEAKKSEADDEPVVIDNNPPVTSLVQLDSLKAVFIQDQIKEAALRKLIWQNEQIKIASLLKTNNLDSLKLELKTATVDTLRAVLNTHIALQYMNYDTIANRDKMYHYQDQAIYYTLQAIKSYAQYNDTIGLRLCFDNLAKVYHAQNKFAQAKWFILQSNTLSRAKKDTPNIIESLLTLSAIKRDIKDYTLAMSDLDEALVLSKNTHTPKTELEILRNYGYLYSLMQNYPKEAQVLRRRELLADSIQKSDEALIAKLAAQKRKQEQLQAKKKPYTASFRKNSKNNSPAKIASL